MLAAPHQRGDDVVDLQNRLNRLGFDCGRPDGILGAATTRAVEDFQRQAGLNPDGICGPQTVHTLDVVGRQSGTGPGVALVREAESMRDHRSLHALRIVVGQFGGLSAITRALARQLRERGATVISTDEYEATAHAAAANRFGASVYLGFEPQADISSNISYFAVPTFESVGGRALATHLVAQLGPAMHREMRLRGMRLPVLRETRMPAVLCELGPVRDVVDSTERIVSASFRAIDDWSIAPNRSLD
ncbi:MAG: peptidoglycan-binding protein [Ilumatobacteraceae bacterium]|nr:peptidoglycan-binding protein [Ilumatobacteraceae bacterium]